MDKQHTVNDELAYSAIEGFWETFPPIWHSVRGYVDRTANQKEITMGGYAILHGIQRGKVTVSELADSSRLSRPAVSRAVDNLVVKNFVSRKTDSTDRRQIKLSLTENGEQLLSEVRDDTRTWMLSKFKDLDEQQIDAIIHAFESLRTAFKR